MLNSYCTYVFDKEKEEIWKIIDDSSSSNYIELEKVYPNKVKHIKKMEYWVSKKSKCSDCREPINIDLSTNRDVNKIIQEFNEKFPEGFL